MSDRPAVDPAADGDDPGRSSPFEDWRGPAAREVLSDGSGVTLVETTEDGEDEPVAFRPVAGAESIDEVFDRFDEESPEEVISATGRQTPGAAVIEGDIDDLFEDLSTVSMAETGQGHPADDEGGGSANPSTESGDGWPDDRLFDDRDGHSRVVGDSAVDDVFGRYAEDSPEDVMEAHDVALESPTAAELRAVGRSDDFLGELPDPPEDARPSSGRRGGDNEETVALERTGDDRLRTVGDSDVTAMFDRYDEDSVAEVIESGNLDPEKDEMVETEVNGSNEIPFGDLSDVDLSTTPVPDLTDTGPSAPPEPAEIAAAIEGLLSDLSGVDIPGDNGHSPPVTAAAIEDLLGDLTAVKTEGSTPMTDRSAGPSEPAVAPWNDPGADDVEEEEVAVGVAVNRTPADSVVDVSATDLYCSFAEGRSVKQADDLSGGGEWESGTSTTPNGVMASRVFGAIGGLVDEVPTATGPAITPETEATPAEIELSMLSLESSAQGDPANGRVDGDDRHQDGAATRPSATTDTVRPSPGNDEPSPTASGAGRDAEVPPPSLATPSSTDEAEQSATDGKGIASEHPNKPTGTMVEQGDDEALTDAAPPETDGAGGARERPATDHDEDPFVRNVSERLEEIVSGGATEQVATDRDEALVGDIEGLFGDLSAVDLSSGPARTTNATDQSFDLSPDSDATVAAVEELFSNLESVEVRPTPVESSDFTPSESTVLSPEPSDGSDPLAGEPDVDAMFEEFEEASVQEVIEADDGPATARSGSPTEGDHDDEPAEVATGDFMEKLAEGKDPEEIGIPLYDGSQTDEGTAIAESSMDTSAHGQSMGSPAPNAGAGAGQHSAERSAARPPDDRRTGVTAGSEDPSETAGSNAASPAEGADRGRTATDTAVPDSGSSARTRTGQVDRSGVSGQSGPRHRSGPSGFYSADDRFRATGNGPGSETLFPAEPVETPSSNSEGETGDDTVLAAFKLLIRRIADRIRTLV